MGGTLELLSHGMCYNDHNWAEEEKRKAEKEPDSVVNNNQLIIWPKAAPASFEVGLSSKGDEMEQLKCSADNK